MAYPGPGSALNPKWQGVEWFRQVNAEREAQHHLETWSAKSSFRRKQKRKTLFIVHSSPDASSSMVSARRRHGNSSGSGGGGVHKTRGAWCWYSSIADLAQHAQSWGFGVALLWIG